MRKNTKIILALLILVSAIIAVNGYYSKDVFNNSDEQIRLSSTVDEKEAAKVKAARELAQSGDVAAAADAFKVVIAETPDDIVYERAIRDYGRILAKTNPQAALEQQILLATDVRIRASARAGAIESLVELYYVDSGLTREQLDATIFANPTFAALQYSGASAPSNERLLLEYANRVSVRPLVSAYLMREYGKAWYEGETELKPSFDEALSLYESLIVDVVETSPVLPKAHAAATAGLFYAWAVDQSNSDYIPDRSFQLAIAAAESITEFFSELSQIPVAELQLHSLAPLQQFHTIFSVVVEVPYTSSTENALHNYDEYLLANTYLNVEVSKPELAELVARVRVTIPVEVAAE